MRNTTPAVDAARYRETLALFATGVTVVAAYDPLGGKPRGMTANAFLSVSLEPPLVLVSVRRDARLHPVLRAAEGYGVSILGADLEQEARRFAGMPVDIDSGPAFVDRAGVPVLEDSIAWVATRAGSAVDAGDHTLFVGEVVDLRPERPDEPALAFHCSAFARVVPSDGPQIPLPFGEWENEVGWWA